MTAAANGKKPETPDSAPDITYTRNRKNIGNDTEKAVLNPKLLLSSPQAVISPGGNVSLLLAIENTGNSPLNGLVAEICFNPKAVQLMRETVWYFRPAFEPTQPVPRLDDGVLLDLPGTIEAGMKSFIVMTFCVHECDIPDSVTFGSLLYGNEIQSVSSNDLTFRVCRANIETHKECVRGSTKNHATYRFVLTNNGTGSACAVTLEDRMPNNFSVEHVLYSGFELAENVQYTVNGNLLCVNLPTCIQPQTSGELTVIGSFS